MSAHEERADQCEEGWALLLLTHSGHFLPLY